MNRTSTAEPEQLVVTGATVMETPRTLVRHDLHVAVRSCALDDA